MQPEDIRCLYLRQLKFGGPIRTLGEWQQLFPAMYKTLVDRAKTVPYDTLPITYNVLGKHIGLPYIPGYAWWPLKMACMLGACAEFEYSQGRPMITSIVVNTDTMKPGQGFWGLDGIPNNLRLYSRHQDYLNAAGKDDRRDAFWIQEMKHVSEFWKNSSVLRPELPE